VNEEESCRKKEIPWEIELNEIFDKMIDKHSSIVDLINKDQLFPDETMNLYNSLIFEIGNDYKFKYKSSIYKDINFINNTSRTFENFCKYYDYKTNYKKRQRKMILQVSSISQNQYTRSSKWCAKPNTNKL
jgi:hypothetical protein